MIPKLVEIMYKCDKSIFKCISKIMDTKFTKIMNFD